MTPRSKVPGLARGIEVLRSLGRRPARSLARLTVELGYPKASLLRILETLSATGLVRKDAQGLYHPLMRLEPLSGSSPSFLSRLESELTALASATETAAEWYTPTERGMLLTAQRHSSESAIRVMAREGFIRTWKGEMDAVRLTAGSACPTAPAVRGSGYWIYNPKAEKSPLSSTQALRLAVETQKRTVTDRFCNRHGIRRMAGTVGQGQTFLGVIALAFPDTPAHQSRMETMRKSLEESIRILEETYTINPDDGRAIAAGRRRGQRTPSPIRSSN
jgi:hypothetical protein